LNVVSVPSISSFEMKFVFPNYLKRKSEIIKGTGNAVIPEGTLVEWKIIGSSTESIVLDLITVLHLFCLIMILLFLIKRLIKIQIIKLLHLIKILRTSKN